MMTHEGENGGVQQNASFASYQTPMDAVNAYINLLQNHYPGAVNAPTLNDFVHGLKVGGYFTAGEGEYRDILSSISQRPDVQAGLQSAGNAVGNAVQTGQQAVQNATDTARATLPSISQFGDKQLTAAEAYAACGPAAAVRFAQLYGRNPTLREATDLASSVGWTADSGMAGLQSESKLFDQMQIPHRVVGADWQALARDAQSGNPVTISTPGHYFTADNYDPSTGAFHVGSSGTDLKVGKEWMTPSQMEAAMGPLQGGLVADNPGVPSTSPVSRQPTTNGPLDAAGNAIGGAIGTAGQAVGNAASAVGNAVQQGGQAIGPGLQQVDNAVQNAVSTAGNAVGTAAGAVGTAASDLGTAAQQEAQRVQQNPQQAVQELVNQAPLPLTGGKVGDLTGAVQNVANQVQVPDETNPLPARVAGGALSAVGTVAKEASDAFDKINIASTAAREATGSDLYDQRYAQAGGPELEDEYRQLLNQRMAGDDSVTPRMTDIVNQLQSINDTIRGGRPADQVNQALSAESPATGPLVTAANLGAAVLAAPLAANDAPLVARAIAEILQPGTNPLELVRALTMVSDTKSVAPEVTRAVDQAWQSVGGNVSDTVAQRAQQIASMGDADKTQLAQGIVDALPGTDQLQKMAGTAELAPVRQQVPQSATDLLQAMLDAARARGVDPEKLSAMEQPDHRHGPDGGDASSSRARRDYGRGWLYGAWNGGSRSGTCCDHWRCSRGDR